MENILKTATLESKLPLLAVENDYLLSKDADITAAFAVLLPELYTLSAEEYEALHEACLKALRVLPEYCIVHKQDIFLREQYRPELQKENLSFLARSFERHFNEREFFAHTCYLFLTKTTRERSRRRSDLSMLCRGRIVPAPMTDAQTLQGFTEAVGQFERILADSGLVSLRRLRDRELTGTRGHAGIIERYLTLSGAETPGLQDIRLDSDRMTVGDKILALYTLSELDDLPALVGTDYRYDRLSTERSDCLLSFAAPVGILLPCEHIYNQMIFLDSPAELLPRIEKTARPLHALTR